MERQQAGNAPSNQSIKSSQDAMRTRVGTFAESVVKMVSPVLLALALRKVDIKAEGKLLELVRGSILPIAAFTMVFSLLQMVWLWLCLSKLLARLEGLQYAASKLLVHFCAILLMFLASDILVLISTKYKLAAMCVAPLVFLIMVSCVWSFPHDEAHDGDMYAKLGCDRELENSVDFSSAFTVLVFLALEHLALEAQQNSNGNGVLESSLVFSFVTCVLGVAIMFIWTIAPPIKHDRVNIDMRELIEASNVVLALFVAGIVFWITWLQLEAYAVWMIVPPLVSLFSWAVKHIDDLDNLIKSTDEQATNGHLSRLDEQNGKTTQSNPGDLESGNDSNPTDENSTDAQNTPDEDSDVKAPSLGLIKFAFAGFLTVSIPSISKSNCGDDSHCIGWTHAFIFLTGMSTVSALVWRLLGHRAKPSSAEVLAANIVSSCAHFLAIAAIIPFGVVADMNARLVVTSNNCTSTTALNG